MNFLQVGKVEYLESITTSTFPAKGRYFYLQEREIMDEIKELTNEETNEPTNEESSEVGEDEKGEDL